MESTTDKNILHDWVHGRDADAFNIITKRYGGLVYAAAARILRNSSDVEDVTQSCFETLAMAARPPEGALAPWLHRVATNRALDLVRTDRNRGQRERTFAEGLETKVEIVWDDIYSYVDEAINELPEELRVVLVERYYLGRSASELAKHLKVDRGTVYRRGERGIELVRKNLRKRGVSVAPAALVALFSANFTNAAQLPTSLSITLGQLAVSGVGTLGVPSVISGLGCTGALLIMKKAAIGIVVIVIAGLGLWRYLNPALPPAEPAPTNYAARSDLDTPASAGEGTTPRGTVVSGDVDELLQADTLTVEGGDITGRFFNRSTDVGVSGLRPHVLEVVNGSVTEKKVPAEGSDSDTDGNYRITNLAPGTYAITPPEVSGFPPLPPAETAMTTLLSGAVVRNVDFPLDPGMRVSGFVWDGNGAPVPEADVIAQSTMGGEAYEVTSSVLGAYTLYLPPMFGVFQIIARKDGMKSPRMNGTLTMDTKRDLVLSVVMNASISGIVLDDKTRPVAGALVGVVGKALDPQERYRSVETDEKGKFFFDALSAGQYGIYLAPPHGVINIRPENIQLRATLASGESLDDLKLSLGANLTIAGQLLNGNGEPIVEAVVRANSLTIDIDRRRRGSQGYGKTDRSGRFVIAGLKAEEFSLQAQPPGLLNEELFEGPYPAGTKNVNLVVNDVSRVKIRGQVVQADTGTPITRFTVSSFLSSACVFHPEGRFEIDVLVDYASINVNATGYAPAVKKLEVSESKPLIETVVAMKVSGRVVGQVVDSQGNGIVGANVFWGTPPSVYSTSQWISRTDSEGRFTADTIPASARTLTVGHFAYPAKEKAIAPEMRFVLEAGGGALGGKVTLHGQPVHWANVSLTQNGAFVEGLYNVSDFDGMYHIWNIPAGDYALELFSKGTRLKQVVEVGGGETIERNIELEPGGATLRGRITGVEKPEHVVFTLDVVTDTDSRQFRGRGDSDGYYQIENVMAGIGQLNVEARRGGASSLVRMFSLQIPEEGELTQDIHFPTGSTVAGVVAGLSSDRRGSVMALNGEIDSSAVVTVEDVEAFLPQIDSLRAGEVECNPAGFYQLDGLMTGTYTLIALSRAAEAPKDIARWAWSTAVIVVEEDGESLTQDFDLR